MQKKALYTCRVEFLMPGSRARGTLVMMNGTVTWWFPRFFLTVQTTTHVHQNVPWFTQTPDALLHPQTEKTMSFDRYLFSMQPPEVREGTAWLR